MVRFLKVTISSGTSQKSNIFCYDRIDIKEDTAKKYITVWTQRYRKGYTIENIEDVSQMILDYCYYMNYSLENSLTIKKISGDMYCYYPSYYLEYKGHKTALTTI